MQTASNQREIALALEGHAGVQVANSVSSAELIAFWEALDGEALGEWRGLCDGAGASRAAGRLLALFESSLH